MHTYVYRHIPQSFWVKQRRQVAYLIRLFLSALDLVQTKFEASHSQLRCKLLCFFPPMEDAAVDLEIFVDHSHLDDAVAPEVNVSETSASDDETSCTQEDIEPQEEQDPDLCKPSSSQAQLTCTTEFLEEEPDACKPSSSQAQPTCTTEPVLR